MKNGLSVLFQSPFLILVAAASFGCSAGVKVKTGTGGSGAPTGSSGATGTAGGSGQSGASGKSGSTGNSGGGSSGNSSGGVDANLSADAACAASSVGAAPVPLDLYFLMDSSKSMLDATGAGTTKWAAVGSALNTFFTDPGSAGLGVALKYFPDEQSAPPATCTMDSQCMVGGTNYGPCDRRETCVGSGASTTEVSPLCRNAATDCGTQACALIQDCSNGNYCAAGPTAAANACTIPGASTACNTFPGYCHLRDICTSTDYATPNVAMMTLPAGATMLASSLSGHTPDGYTPTARALEGAVAFAQQRQASNPDHKVAIVLVTDGLPGGFLPGFPPPECEPSNISGAALATNTTGIPNISSIAMMAATANPSILTFVVGIFNPATAEGMAAPANLAALAIAGGTGSAVILDVTQNNVTQKLHDALTQAQTKAIACSYQIPAATHGSVDFSKVNVQFTSGAGAVQTIGQTTGAGACAAGGWYYDVDPMVGTPTRIIACDSTCSQFQTDTSGHVDLLLGCVTIKIG